MSTTSRARPAAAQRRPRAGRVLWAGLAVVLLVLLADPAAAHVRASTGWSQIRSDGDRIDYRLSLEYEILARAIGMGTAAIEAPDDTARLAELTGQHDLIETYLAGRIEIFVDDVECDMDLDEAGVEQRPHPSEADRTVPYAVLQLGYDCHGATSGAYTVDYSVFSGLGSDAVVDDHTNTVDYDLGGERGRVVLDGGHPGFSTGERSFGSSVLRSVGLGAESVLGGLDHALFVAVLVLGATTLPAVARSVATFAVAHSASMLLAVAGWANLPAEIVGPLVALSIVYVAVSNVVGTGPRYRHLAVFGFGLLHGFALAGEQRFDDDLSWDLVTSYAGFNLGIELGQVLLVAALFPLLAVLRRFPWFSLAHVTVAGAAAATGLAWFVQRLL